MKNIHVLKPKIHVFFLSGFSAKKIINYP